MHYQNAKIRSFFSFVFSVFRLNTGLYGVDLHIQSKYGKYGPAETPYLDTFYAVKILGNCLRNVDVGVFVKDVDTLLYILLGVFL